MKTMVLNLGAVKIWSSKGKGKKGQEAQGGTIRDIPDCQRKENPRIRPVPRREEKERIH